MRSWLTIEVALGLLLVTSFTCAGLVALWAATSRRNWFLRAAAVVAFLPPVLLMPAYGPFLIGLSASVFTCVGFVLYRTFRSWLVKKWAVGRSDNEHCETMQLRFSVQSALGSVAIISVLVAVAVRIPVESWQMSPISAMSGLAIALITLAASWVVCGESRWRVRAEFALALVLLLTLGIVTAARYPQGDLAQMFEGMFQVYFSINHAGSIIVIAAMLGQFANVLVTILLAKHSFGPQLGKRSRHQLARGAFAFWCAILLGPPAIVVAALARPIGSIPITAPPNPNGYDRLVEIGKRFEHSAIMKELAADEVDESKLFAAIPQYATDFSDAREALKLPFQLPIHYEFAQDVDTDSMSAMRSLLEALDAKADATRNAGDVDESIACSEDMLRLGNSIERQGLLIHYLVGSGFERIAAAKVHRAMTSMDEAQCRRTAATLSEFDRRRADIDGVVSRERVWIARTHGWMARFGLLLSDFYGNSDSDNMQQAKSAWYPRDQALTRMLVVGLAVHAYQLKHGADPTQLNVLVPQYLDSVPSDPFDPRGGPIRYRVDGDSCLLYSIGPDGRDDGGRPFPRDAYGGLDFQGEGDFRLDEYMAWQTNPAAASDGDNLGNADTKANVEGIGGVGDR